MTDETLNTICGVDALTINGIDDDDDAIMAPCPSCQKKAQLVHASVHRDAYGFELMTPICCECYKKQLCEPNPMTLPDKMERIFQECVALARRKNADYSHDDPDGFGNFRMLGEALVETGLIIRLSDKFARLKSHVSGGKLMNESVDDTLRDIINYSAILLAWRQR